MYIQEDYRELDLIRYETVREILRDGSSRSREMPILVEHSIQVWVNGKLTMELTCTSQYLAELLLGRLLTEGIIGSADEVESIHIDGSGRCGRVELRITEAQDISHENTLKTEDKKAADAASLLTQEVMPPAAPVPWKEEWIFALADRFAEGMPLHQETWATHSCFLSMEGKILFQCEDMGRHNAFDKVIGYALRNQIDLKRCVVYSSGRIPADMVMKAVKAGIPVLAAKAAPTLEAVRLARQRGLTLICFARRDRMRRL